VTALAAGGSSEDFYKAIRENNLPQLKTRGVTYLLKTQQTDGSWHGKSRAPKFQPYFESGFPYGPDQWISASATAWATIALANGMGGSEQRAAK
jgi:hypothetical protein